MKTHILAIGKLSGAHAELSAEYVKRLTEPTIIKELPARAMAAEGKALLAATPVKAFVIVLDEGGKDLTSRELADKIKAWKDRGARELVFVIGGADGLAPDIKERANFVLSLGRKTWPHKLARVMLLEQLYRAQQINSGHPYHRGS